MLSSSNLPAVENSAAQCTSPVLLPHNMHSKITFVIRGEVSVGQHVRIVAKSTSGWNYKQGYEMTTEGPEGADLPVWKAVITLPRKTMFEYCYIATNGVDYSPVSSTRKLKVKLDSTVDDQTFGIFMSPDLRSSVNDDHHWISSTHNFKVVLGYPQTHVLKSGHPFIGVSTPCNNEIYSVNAYIQDATSSKKEITSLMSNIHEPMNFRIDRISETSTLYFDFNSTSEVVGKAVVLLSQLTQHGNGNMTVPVISTSFIVIGSVTFSYVHTAPFVHPSFLDGKVITRKLPFPSKQNLVGHRGSGSSSSQALTVDRFVRSHIKENTILSFTQAGERGASFVEFDVHLTSDLVPVIYHDFSVETENGIPVPIHNLTLEKFRSMGRRTVKSTKTLLDVRSPSPSRQPIFDAFPTLVDTLTQVPKNIGFNIEIKYPIKDEIDKYNISPVDRNTYLDRILWDVFEHAKGRNIYFSSFDPDICAMLVHKQPLYPVLFLTQMGTTIRSDPRCNSPEASIEFAKSHGLSGLVCPATFLLSNPQVVKQIKEAGLELASWGADNNNPVNVQKQLEYGLNAAIVDHVAHIHKHAFSPQPIRTALSAVISQS